jgi:hypothetical protein
MNMSMLNDFEQTNHKISLEDAIAMTTRYRKEMPGMLQPEYAGSGILPVAETFKKSIFTDLSVQPGCVAIRTYLGMDEKKMVRLIFVGVNDQNEDILPLGPKEGGSIYEFGQRCPPICGVSPLNPQV